MRDYSGPQAVSLGRSFARLGAKQVRVAEKLQDRVDDAWTKEQLAHLSNGYREILTSPDGYLNSQGREAVDGREDLVKALDEKRAALLGGAQNSTQREMFSQQAERDYQRALEMVDGHYVKQSRAWELAGSKARAQAKGLELVDTWFTTAPETFADAEDEYFGDGGMLDDLFGQQNMHPDQVAGLKREAQDDVYAAIVGRLLKSDPRGAKDFLTQAVKDKKISPAKRAEISGFVDKAVADTVNTLAAVKLEGDILGGRAAQEPKAVEIIGPTPPAQYASPMTLAAHRATYLLEALGALDAELAAGKITGEQHKARFATIEKRHKLRGDAVAKIEKEALTQAEAILIANPMMSPDDLATVAPGVFKTLVQSGQWSTINTFSNSNGRYPNRPVVAAALPDVSRETWRSKSATQVYNMLRGELDNKNLDRALAFHAEANDTANDKQSTAMSTDRRIRHEFRELHGLVAGTIPGNMANELDHYTDRVTELINTYERDTLGGKRLVNEQELQSLLDWAQSDLVMRSDVGFDDAVSFYALTEDQQEEAYVTVRGKEVLVRSVPTDVRDKIVEEAQVQGQRLATAQIVRYWVRIGKPADLVAYYAASQASVIDPSTLPIISPTDAPGVRELNPALRNIKEGYRDFQMTTELLEWAKKRGGK